VANDIKQKIVLEGEKEYNRALTDAKRNLKTLRSELKAETAELGNNATAQQKNEKRIESLRKQIKEQEKIVKTYQEALKEVKTKYSDNEEAIAKWEVKLNDARTALANMKNDLEGVGKSFKDIEGSADMATVATKSVADTFSQLSDIGGAISDSIEQAFTGLLGTAKQVIGAIWENIVDLAARSNNLVDLAGFWNTDVTTIQKYAGAVQEVSGNLEDLSSLVTKINSADVKKVTELTGVSKAEYKDQWKYAMTVMDALSEMNKDVEKRNNAAFEIFGGKQATKAFDLLNDWEKLQDKLDKYDAEKGGYGLTEEELKNMSDLYDTVNGLNASWQSLRDMATVKLFGDLAISVTGNAQAIMDAMLKYMNAGDEDERNAALKEIEDNILAIFTKAKEAIEEGIEMLDKIAEDLKLSDNPTAKALGNVIDGLVEALKWLTKDNMHNVIVALDMLAGFWLAGKGLAMGTKIASIVKDIATIQAFNAGGGAGTAAAAAGSSVAGGGGLFATMKAGLATAGKVLPFALPAILAVDRVVDIIQQTQEALAKGQASIDNFSEMTKRFGGTEAYELWSQLYGYQHIRQEGEGSGEAWADMDKFAETWQKWLNDEIENRSLDEMWDRMTNEQANAFREAMKLYISDANLDPEEMQEKVWGPMQEAIGILETVMQESADGDDMARLTEGLNALADAYTLDGAEDEYWKNNGGNSGNQDGLTSSDAKNMTDAVNRMPAAMQRAMGNIRVIMDGQTVGNLVAPYVSQFIGMGIG